LVADARADNIDRLAGGNVNTTSTISAACLKLLSATVLALAAAGFPATASVPAEADPFLDEIVDFTGGVFFLEHKVPGLIIGAVANGDISVHGYGERAGEGSGAPNGNTVMRLGSITKAFTGQVLAALTVDGTVQLAQPLIKTAPEFAVKDDVAEIRLIDLVTHAGGLPRELPHEPGPKDNPHAPITIDAFADWLKTNPLLFKPGHSVLYSNFGFDLLSHALANAAKKPYPELLEENITGPLEMKDTVFNLSADQKQRLMQGHGFGGEPLPDIPTGDVVVGSGGLYSTANDLLRWMQWHLDRFGEKDAEVRLIDHGLYLVRDGLDRVSGMDESGRMDAMGLAWVGMMPEGDRPFILQKAGGMQGMFCYIAFAPAKGVAVFVAINKYDFGAAIAMGQLANELIATLSPR
jgi:D-alanyl-D-alanine-carboxypeptidase/D-alanyl-D-alanine-endopeptidase